jgi:hypothetical protein
MRQFAATLFTSLVLALMAAPAESGASLEEVRAQIHKGGSGTWLRKQFPRDIVPIALTPGGVGTLVVLYTKTSNLSIPLCTAYDVVMGVKPGRVTTGWKCGPERCDD